jgi:hypothetical protein
MFMRRALVAAGVGVLVIGTIALSSEAQLPTYGLGRPPTAEQIKAWDVTIPSDGTGLPPGSGTAALGKPIYTERCASCHGPSGADGKYDRLVGGRGTLTTDKPVLTIGSLAIRADALELYQPRQARRRARLSHARAGVRDHGVPAFPEWDYRRT